MSEHRSVTREDIERAFRDATEARRRGGYDVDGESVFDALPAIPPASGDVDAAWEALHRDLSADDIHVASILAAHRPRIEAAIRAESAGLDVSDERLGDAIHNAAHPHHPWSGCQYPDIWYHKVRLFRARLAEDADA